MICSYWNIQKTKTKKQWYGPLRSRYSQGNIHEETDAGNVIYEKLSKCWQAKTNFLSTVGWCLQHNLIFNLKNKHLWKTFSGLLNTRRITIWSLKHKCDNCKKRHYFLFTATIYDRFLLDSSALTSKSVYSIVTLKKTVTMRTKSKQITFISFLSVLIHVVLPLISLMICAFASQKHLVHT